MFGKPMMKIARVPPPHEVADVIEALAAKRAVEERLTTAKTDRQRLLALRDGADRMGRYEALRDLDKAEMELIAAEHAALAAQRAYETAFERASPPHQAYWMGRLREKFSHLSEVLRGEAHDANEALRQVRDAAEAEGVKLPYVHLRQLTRDALTDWEQRARRELGLGPTSG